MVSWNDASHVVWNLIATAVWLAPAVLLLRVPTEDFRKGWRSKVLWLVLSLGVSLYYRGFLVPLGWIVALIALHFDRKPLDSAVGTQDHHA